VKIVPTTSDYPAYSMTVTLEGEVYRLVFRWNVRGAFWTMDVKEQDETVLLAGIKLVANWPLTDRYVNPDLPPGDFMAYDTAGTGLDPGREDLGGRVLLLYLTEAEVAALQ